MNTFTSLTKEAPPLREEFAYETIKEAILCGDLLPNQIISLSSLARSLGISIIPVKTAVQKLISEGLINQDAHHSPIVAEFSSKQTNEVLVIRYHLEELALREAILHIDDVGIAILHNYLDKFREAVSSADNHTYGRINRSFHMTIYEFSGYPLLCNMIDDLWNKAELNRCRSVFILVPDMIEHSFNEHLELVKLIEERNVEAAIPLLHKHKRFSKAKLIEALKESDKKAADS